jgi:RsiW-degrading membrane proteinase PrsW (M82 family)
LQRLGGGIRVFPTASHNGPSTRSRSGNRERSQPYYDARQAFSIAEWSEIARLHDVFGVFSGIAVMVATVESPVRQCGTCGLFQPPANFCRRCGSSAPYPVSADRYWGQKRNWLRPIGYSTLTLIFASMLGCVLLVLLGSTGFHIRSILLAVGAAVLPTIAYAGVIFWLDRTEPDSWNLRILTFLWGAVVAVFIALILNTTAFSIFSVLTDADTGTILTAVISAPLVEESAKGILVLLVLWFTRRNIDSMLDGLVLGALVGLGFAMTENIMYFGSAYADGGVEALGALFIVRCLINGMGHAVWTSFTGAAVGWSRGRHGRGILRFIVPVLGWGTAVSGHAIWNIGATITISLINILLIQIYRFSEWKAFIAAGIIGGLPFVVPTVLLASIFARLGREQEERIIRTYLPIEVHLGTLTMDEARRLADRRQRDQRVRHLRREDGRIASRRQHAFDTAATRLAFFHYHALRGERPDRETVVRAEQLRWQIAALRWASRADRT